MNITQAEIDTFTANIELIRDRAWNRGFKWGVIAGATAVSFAWLISY